MDDVFIKFYDLEEQPKDDHSINDYVPLDNQIKYELILDNDKISLPIIRAILGLLSLLCLYLAFYYAGLCAQKINNGIISSVFSTCLIFVSVLFYAMFNQHLSKKVIFGNAFILISVFMISIS